MIVTPKETVPFEHERALIAQFAEQTGRPREFDHPMRVAEIMMTYAGVHMPPEAYGPAAYFHDLADRTTSTKYGSESRMRAGKLLSEYFLDNELAPYQRAQRRYIGSIIVDGEITEHTAKSYRQTLPSEDSIFRDIINNGFSDEIPKQYWMQRGSLCSPESMLRLLEKVNIEDVPLKAAELIDNVTHPPTREAALYQDILEGEYFFAPLLETLAYDAMAMQVRDICNRQRLYYGGHKDILARAFQIHNTFRNQERISVALGQLFNQTVLHERVTLDNYDTHSYMAEARVDFRSVKNVRATLRLKSVGSIGWSIYQNGADPMDVLGVTLITPDRTTMLTVFDEVVDMLSQKTKTIKFKAIHGKKSPFCIRGEDAFLHLAQDYYGAEVHMYDVKETENEYHVIKTTQLVEVAPGISVPVEIQVMSEEDRRNTRLGYSSHMSYKADHVKIDPEILARIHARKSRMRPDHLEINGQSIDRLQRFYRSLTVPV